MDSMRGRFEIGWSWLTRDVVPAEEGSGPLLQRDYWAAVANARLRPSEIIAEVTREFERFPPEELVGFERRCEPGRALAVGDELDIHIRMAGECAVRVVHADANSLTLATLEGHPEAGRITFGSYRNDRGEVLGALSARSARGARAGPQPPVQRPVRAPGGP
jgi:hypothetical protein